MPRFEGATYFDLKGGLNTESSPLNIPPTDAVSVENIDINIDGSIQRRRAIDFLGAASSGTMYKTSGIADYTAISGGVLRAEVPSFAQFNPLSSTGLLARHAVVHFGQDFLFYDYASPEDFKKRFDVVEQNCHFDVHK